MKFTEVREELLNDFSVELEKNDKFWRKNTQKRCTKHAKDTSIEFRLNFYSWGKSNNWTILRPLNLEKSRDGRF